MSMDQPRSHLIRCRSCTSSSRAHRRRDG